MNLGVPSGFLSSITVLAASGFSFNTSTISLAKEQSKSPSERADFIDGNSFHTSVLFAKTSDFVKNCGSSLIPVSDIARVFQFLSCCSTTLVPFS